MNKTIVLNLSNHIAVTSYQKVRAICHPLFEATGLIFLWVEFPAACRDHMKDERIYTQKPQRDGTALPFGISSKVPSVDI